MKLYAHLQNFTHPHRPTTQIEKQGSLNLTMNDNNDKYKKGNDCYKKTAFIYTASLQSFCNKSVCIKNSSGGSTRSKTSIAHSQIANMSLHDKQLCIRIDSHSIRFNLIQTAAITQQQVTIKKVTFYRILASGFCIHTPFFFLPTTCND